jgi:hypothetical protein
MFQIVAGLGGLLLLIAHVMVVLTAFRKGLLWGLAVLFIPIVTLIFVILNWSETRRAVILYVVGSLLAGFGGLRMQEYERGHRSGGAVDV